MKAIITLVLSVLVISWMLGVNHNNTIKIETDDNEEYLSINEAKEWCKENNKTYKPDKIYFSKQESKFRTRRTWIPFIRTKDTIYIQEKKFYTKNY